MSAPWPPEDVPVLPEGVVAALRFPVSVSALEPLTEVLERIYGPDLVILTTGGPYLTIALPPEGRTTW